MPNLLIFLVAALAVFAIVQTVRIYSLVERISDLREVIGVEKSDILGTLVKHSGRITHQAEYGWRVSLAGVDVQAGSLVAAWNRCSAVIIAAEQVEKDDAR